MHAWKMCSSSQRNGAKTSPACVSQISQHFKWRSRTGRQTRNASKTTILCGVQQSDSILLIRCRAVSPSDSQREVHKSLSGTEGGKTRADPRLILHCHTIKQTVLVPCVWQRRDIHTLVNRSDWRLLHTKIRTDILKTYLPFINKN